MKNNFLLWLQKHKNKSITKPERYVTTITTISNDLAGFFSREINLYNIQDISEIQKMEEMYFSIPEYYEKNKKGNHMYSRALDLYMEYMVYVVNSQDIIEEQILLDDTLSETERKCIILSRIGQGTYRNDLMKLWNERCAISGVSQSSLLIASHIKPWKNSNNKERIDKYNGLLLLPTYDKLFDLGLISFQNNGFIIISDRVLEPNKLSISPGIQIKLFSQNIEYIEYHREYIFSNN